MSILSAYNLTQTFGHHTIFQGISAKIEQGGKIGLVGPNGVGKTSLLRILAGLDQPADGGAHRASGIRLGYLHQEAVDAFASRDHTVYGEMFTVFAPLRALESRMATIEARMAAGELTNELFADYSDLQAAYEHQGGYTYETRIEQVLQGLHFAEADWQTPLKYLSGGQKTRALLARLLLAEPDLLMLDEPTNHLDVQAIAWLETMLQQWSGALLVVSHDRYFLDSIVNTIWEMSATEIEVYRGNYSAYTRQRAERWARRQKEFDATHERLSKEMNFIYKHMAGRGRNMAMGKLRRISDELGAEGRALKVDRAKAKFKELRRPSGDWAQMNMELATSQQSGQLVLRTRDLIVGYEEPLFMADDIKLQRGACAALIGPNGVGKTTLLRTLLGQLPPLMGTVHLGQNVRIGYFAQAHDTLNPHHTVLEAVLSQPRSAQQPVLEEGAARSYLARYLFQGDDVFKAVRALSGGERGRLALALLARQGANLLLLDEPTNHLDLPAQEVLQTVLEQYDGTILLISHDRYLINQLATEIWELRDGVLTVFAGGYQDFVAQGMSEGEHRLLVPAAALT
ncbi:MAG: ABC-F family ATP-binding cassette domain-containing protein [Caldilineaceae bacterium]